MKMKWVQIECDQCGTADRYGSGPVDEQARNNGWIITREGRHFCDSGCRDTFRVHAKSKMSLPTPANKDVITEDSCRGNNAIRQLPVPTDGERVETGPVQFGKDWPGVFLRGDRAASEAMLLHKLITEGTSDPETSWVARMLLIGFYNTLRSATIGPAIEMLPEIDPASLQTPAGVDL